MAVASYLADTSVLARRTTPSVAARFEPLVERGLVATCAVIDLEVLYSTRSPSEYEEVRAERRGFEMLEMDEREWLRALAVQRMLAAGGRTRAVGIPDLLIAATAERHGVTLLHYDSDFDQVAAATGQPVEWVVDRGSVP